MLNNNNNFINHRIPNSNAVNNMGVAWFYNACPASSDHSANLNHSNSLTPPPLGSSPHPMSNRLPALNIMDNNNRQNYQKHVKPCEPVDIIDIEDEDHSFAAFFIGMKTGPSPYVKRPLVGKNLFLVNFQAFLFYFSKFLIRHIGD